MAFFKKYFENPFSGDRHKGINYDIRSDIMTFVLVYILCVLSLHFSYWYAHGMTMDALFDKNIENFYMRILQSKGFSAFQEYLKWATGFIFNFKDTPIFPIFPIFSFYFINKYLRNRNPWKLKKFLKTGGTGHEAEDADIEKMKLFDGTIIVLGKFKKRLLKLPETLSVLVSAPPGTGKTTAIIIPTLFNCNTASIIVNDPKPELCFQTSGYRATLGPVFVLNWGAQDDPENGIYYPSWNPLSPRLMPKQGPDRDMYVEAMANVLIQDPVGGSGDSHWTNGGRNALNGLFHFMVSKFERAKKSDYFYHKLREGTFSEEDKKELAKFYIEMDDPFSRGAYKMLTENRLDFQSFVPIGTWENIPREWRSKEASIPLVLDWITEGQLKTAQAINDRQKSGDQSAMFADPMKDFFANTVAEAVKYKYSHRCVLELNQLTNTPDKERGSILSNALMGISIFKNSAVRERTCSTSIDFGDLRGMLNPATGKFEPVTVYLSVNIEYARALNKISGMFIELMSKFLIAHKPGADFLGKTLGPCDIIFALDEFPQMPKLEAIIDGPAVGRGQRISYLLICQDLGQIESGYGKDAVETIMSTTAAKVVLAQNNQVSAERFARMIGNKSVRDNAADGKIDDFSVKLNTTVGSEKIFTDIDLMGLEFGQQVVLYQGFPETPIKCDSPFWFKDPEQTAKKEMPSAPFMPAFVLERELEEKRLAKEESNNYTESV